MSWFLQVLDGATLISLYFSLIVLYSSPPSGIDAANMNVPIDDTIREEVKKRKRRKRKNRKVNQNDPKLEGRLRQSPDCDLPALWHSLPGLFIETGPTNAGHGTEAPIDCDLPALWHLLPGLLIETGPAEAKETEDKGIEALAPQASESLHFSEISPDDIDCSYDVHPDESSEQNISTSNSLYQDSPHHTNHPCSLCERSPSKRCSGCSKAWYCSSSCQRENWPVHVFRCNPRQPIKTAYHLARAVYRDILPTDQQTCADYGFDRALTIEDKVNLFGLYIGLIKFLEVKPLTLHQWLTGGTLVQNIKAEYNALPPESQGGYYPWFLKNQHVLDPSFSPPNRDHVENSIRRAWQFIGGSTATSYEQIRSIVRTWPRHKSTCMLFYSLLLNNVHPSPNETELYMGFGFCACGEYSEMELGAQYRQLIHKCTFSEFVAAYEKSAFIALFESKGIQIKNRAVKDVLLGPSKNVWSLKAYLFADNAELEPSVWADYGFMRCKDETEKEQLIAVYREALDTDNEHMALKLHESLVEGKLFEFVESLQLTKMKGKKKMFRRLMRALSNTW